MNLLTLLPGALKAIGGLLGIGPKVQEVISAIEGASGSPELRAQLQAALFSHEAEMKRLSIEEMRTAMSEGLAMIASPDRYVSRARPTGLYIFYAVSAAMSIGKNQTGHLTPAGLSGDKRGYWNKAACAPTSAPEARQAVTF